MSVVQISLEQVLSGLKQSFYSIDIRTAINKDNLGIIHHALTGIRISTRSVEAVRQRYTDLERKYGGRQAARFGILWEVFPFIELDRIASGLALSGELTVEQHKLRLSRSINIKSLTGRVERRADYVRPWDEEQWPGMYCFTGDRSHTSEDITADIRGTLGFRSADEMVDTFLEVSGSSNRRLDLFIYVEMPARISHVQAIGRALVIEVAAEKNLGNFHLFLSRRDPSGQRVIENVKLELDQVGETQPFVLFRTMLAPEQARDEESISCVLTHGSVPELDEVIGRFREFLPPQEKNPLLECLKQFWDMEKLYQQVERPYDLPTYRMEIRPQLAFQKSVARLLSLAGFRTIDLERDDRMYHPETNVERATIDILAFHQASGILILGACTIYVPKTEDYDKLLHATAILKKLFPRESHAQLVPVLFSAQENISPFRGDAAKMGMRLMNVHELTVLRQLVESGDEDKFVAFLNSPFNAELRGESTYVP